MLEKMTFKVLAYELVPFVLVALLSAVNFINGQLAWSPIQVDSQSKYAEIGRMQNTPHRTLIIHFLIDYHFILSARQTEFRGIASSGDYFSNRSLAIIVQCKFIIFHCFDSVSLPFSSAAHGRRRKCLFTFRILINIH